MEIKQNKIIIEFLITENSNAIYTNVLNIVYNDKNGIEISSAPIEEDSIPNMESTAFFPIKNKVKIAEFIRTIIRSFNNEHYNINFSIEEGKEYITFTKEDAVFDTRYLLRGCISIGHGIATYLYTIRYDALQEILSDLRIYKKESIEKEIKASISNYTSLDKKRNNEKIAYTNGLIIEVSGFVAGYIFHEIIGHLLEEDFYKLPNVWIRYNYKETIPRWLAITHDSGPYPEILGLGKYDDNGDLFIDNILIEEGKVKNSIGHGNYRKESIMSPSLPRMRTINIISDKKDNHKDYINNDSIYIHSIKAGMVNPYTGDFQLKGMHGYFHRNENLSTSVLDITGNVNDLMGSIITAVGDNDFCTGTCIKNNQRIAVGMNSPGILFLCNNIKVIESEERYC
jgi:hypothetical protein